MGVVKKLIWLSIFAVLASYAVNFYQNFSTIPPLPKPDEDRWWGPGKAAELGSKIRPFKIDIPKEVIDDLNERLDRFLKITPIPPLEGQGFQYGFNTNYLRTVIDHWRNNYQWKEKREVYLNQYPQFKTFINGLDIHFIRVAPKDPSGKKVLPLLLVHGWPGSVREFYDIIPLLTTPRDDADFVFEVVVPSLPGYGFSAGASKTGLGVEEIAVLFNKLMRRLGFEKYYVQGGDWGSVVTRNIGTLYKDNVLGAHSNFCLVQSGLSFLKWIAGSFYPTLVVEEKFVSRLYPFKNHLFNLLEETGYMHIQATKPDTIGTVLKDTPAGLAAYILEKFSTWTNPEWKKLSDGGLTKKFTLDALLDNVMIYWVTGSITTSQRLYAENFSLRKKELEKIPISVPTACARFKHELMWQPESFLKEKYVNLLQVSDFEDGGHFAAFELPKELSRDIWSAVKKFEAYHNAAQKKSNI